MSNGKVARILIVDDTPENIDILVGLLGETYELSVALNGEDALKRVEQYLPDLILLDIMMPGRDGYSVCEVLKKQPDTVDIPVIFLTALTSPDQEQKGLDLGAVDYITKPFSPPLVCSRIANHLALAQARTELKRHGEHLEELVRQRTAQLEEANGRLKAIDETKNEFLCAISHELRTPANGVLGIGELAVESLPPGAEKDELRTLFDQSMRRLIDVLDGAMHLAQLQSGDAMLNVTPVNLTDSVQQAIDRVNREVPGASVQIHDRAGFSGVVCVDSVFFEECMTTLLTAAVKLNSQGNLIVVSGAMNGTQLSVVIHVEGGGIADELCRTIFEPFSAERSASYVEELGFRLPVAEKMMRAMGGEVALENLEGNGFAIRISLPLADACLRSDHDHVLNGS
jgi:CheY-like chemotaxis protein